jgi:hypothetical protein
MPQKTREMIREMHTDGRGLDEIGRRIDARPLDRDAAAAA